MRSSRVPCHDGRRSRRGVPVGAHATEVVLDAGAGGRTVTVGPRLRSGSRSRSAGAPLRRHQQRRLAPRAGGYGARPRLPRARRRPVRGAAGRVRMVRRRGAVPARVPARRRALRRALLHVLRGHRPRLARAGSRAGATATCPTATMRHLHAATSVEGSAMFNHFVERNRLLMLAKNAPGAMVRRGAGRVRQGARRDRLARRGPAGAARAPARRRPRASPDPVVPGVPPAPSLVAGRPTADPSPAHGARRRHHRVGRVRAAVYNRYWPTGGGGEAYGAGVAHVLRQRGDVDLLCHEPVDIGWLSERLRVDLGGVSARVIDDRPGPSPPPPRTTTCSSTCRS